MASPEEPNNPTPIEPEAGDLATIRQLVKLMARYDLTAIDLGDGPSRVRLRRRGAELPAPHAAAPPIAYAQPPAAFAPPPTASAQTAAPLVRGSDDSSHVFVESPMVGTFYSSSSPDAPSFVQVGASIRPDTIVCIIEAMKVFTDIPAGVTGKVAEVLVKSGQAVEYGQKLYRVVPE